MAVKLTDPRDIDGAYEDRFNDPTGKNTLQDLENSTDDSYTGAGIDQAEAFANDPANATDLGIAARNAEQTSGQWVNNTAKQAVASAGGVRQLASKAKVLFQKKGAIATIVAVLGIGGSIPFIGTGTLPFSIIGNQDAKSMLRGLDQYQQDFLSYKLFGSNKAASLKNGKKGALSGIRDADIKKLEAQGITFRGGTKNKVTGLTTFTQVQYNGGRWINAGKEFNDEIRRNPAFRKSIVFTKTSYFKSSKSAAVQRVKSLLGVSTNPKIDGKTDDERNKSLYTQSVAGSESALDGKVNNQTGEDGDADSNQGKGDNIAGVSGEAAEKIEENKASFTEGNFTDAVAKDSDMSNIASQMDRGVTDVVSETSGIGSKIWGFVNVLDPLDMICTTYQIAHTAEMAARGVALANTVKFAFMIRSTIERAKAGDDDGESTRYLMELIQRKDPETGRSFDSSSYAAFLFSGKLSSEPSSVSAFGGQSMIALMMGMRALHLAVGGAIGGGAAEGRYALRNGCNIITNLGVQIVATVGVAVASVFTAGGAAAGTKAAGEIAEGGLKVAREKIAEAVVGKFGKAAIKEEVGKIGSEGAMKYFASRAWKGFKVTWSSLGVAGKAGFLLAAVSTFAMPYIINALSGGTIAGFMKNGFAAFEGAGTGFNEYESKAALAAGGTIGTGETAALYKPTQNEYEQRYIADAKYDAKDTPLDIKTPYSSLGSAVLSVQKTIGISNSLDIFSTFTSLASLPLRLPGLGSVAHAADDDATPRKITAQVGNEFAIENDIALTVTGSPQVVFNKKLSFEDVEDKFINGANPMLTYYGNDEETGEPNVSLIPGTPLDEYVKKCKDPNNSEIDPEYREDGSSDYLNECVKHEGHPEYADYDDAYRFINQIAPEAKAAEQAAASGGVVAIDGFAWPFGEEDFKDNGSLYTRAHGGGTGTAWGSDSMGTSGKGAGIAIDIGKSENTKVHALFSGTVTSVSLCGVGDGVAIKSDVEGKELGVAYMHGKNKQVAVGDTVAAGDYIMDVGNVGCNSEGAHLHIGIAYDGAYICPQDVFTQAGTGNMSFDFGAMKSKANSGCGR